MSEHDHLVAVNLLDRRFKADAPVCDGSATTTAFVIGRDYQIGLDAHHRQHEPAAATATTVMEALSRR